ncbi:MAG TPA: peptidoglycan-binding protein [Frankiaceae bacterium]|nr:peptidoglycan-binding protein [Frankiaceae bacterium]
MKKRLMVGIAAVALVGAGAVLRVREPRATAAPVAPKVATAQVKRTDLVVTKDVDGTAGYAGSFAVPNRLAGTLTSVAAPGATVRRGGVLYAVDAQPVRLLYGAVPAYRALALGAEGADVAQLERNLAGLGHFAGTPDDEYDWATRRAVQAWQDATGEAETGQVEPGRVVFAPYPLRVTKAAATVGAQVGPGSLLDATGTRRVVRVDLAVADARLVKTGGRVTVEPPAGRDLTGTVSSIGTVAQQTADGGSPTVELVVTLPGDPDLLDGAPVTVRLVSESRKGVLAVPVEALLALREGGYAVELPGRGLVGVETGVFANGLVEVTGVAEGTTVVVPAP